MMLMTQLVVVMLVEQPDQFSRLDDGVDAEMRRAGMRSHAMDSDDRADAAFVRRGNDV